MKKSACYSRLILLALFLSFNSTLAQPDTLWTACFGGSGNDYGHSAIETTDDGAIIVGGTLSFSASQDVYLVKTDDAGVLQWSQTYGGTANDYGKCIRSTNDGGYIIAGYSQSYTPGGFYLIKITSTGIVEWSNTYGGGIAYSVEQTTDGGYILGGSSGSNAYLVKTDSLGNTIWTHSYGTFMDEDGHCAQQTADGGYIVVGFEENLFSYQRGVWLFKTNANGDMLWQRFYWSTGDCYGHWVEQSNDGGYIVTGYHLAGDYDVYVLKTDSLGNEEWEHIIGRPNDDEAGSCVKQTYDGGYIISASTNWFFTGNSEAWLIKLDASGNIEWDQTYGGSQNDFASSVWQTGDNGYIIGGSTSSYGAGNSDLYLVRTEPEELPEATITLTPYGAPIQIPPGGGSFSFNIAIANNSSSPVDVDIWTMVTLPSGAVYGPIINAPFTLPPTWSGNRDRIQVVPAGAPPGDYTYDAYIGDYPTDIWDEDHFDFEKLAIGDGPNISTWSNWGEEFDDFSLTSEAGIPSEFMFYPAYPNPFNPTTVLSYRLPVTSKVILAIYNMSGGKVAELVNGMRDAGSYEVTFDASNLVSGVYFVRLEAGGFRGIQKILLVK